MATKHNYCCCTNGLLTDDMSESAIIANIEDVNKMDHSRNIGKIKEQIAKESQVRRNCTQQSNNQMYHELYNPDCINRQLRQQMETKEFSPYLSDGHGEAYFMSPEMYEALVAKCRCGRQRAGTHVLKCLQKEQNKYLMQCNDEKDDLERSKSQRTRNDSNHKELPKTSNGIIGWRRNETTRYNRWEQSMKYVSPVLSMTGPRITAVPYNAIIIG